MVWSEILLSHATAIVVGAVVVALVGLHYVQQINVKSTLRVPSWPKRRTQYSPRMKFVSGSTTGKDGQTPILGSAIGRQIWREDKETEPQTYEFSVHENPNSGDRVYRDQMLKKKQKSLPQSNKSNNTADKVSSKNKSKEFTALLKGIDFYQQLQSDDGCWFGDYGGPMFLMPGLIITCYIIKHDLGENVKNGIMHYIANHQQTDGGWGLHIEQASTMIGTVLNYVSLRLLGVDAENEMCRYARAFILKQGGAIYIPSWGKFWLACLNVYDWAGCDSLPPEMWLLPNWFPFHPGKTWCHCRVVYLPMSFIYAKRYQAPLDSLLESIRSEIYVELSYNDINWSHARRSYCSLDEYSKPSLLIRILNEVLAIYEGYMPMKSVLRDKGSQFASKYMHQEDIQTNYVNIGPVNKSLNMLCAFLQHHDDALHLHIQRIEDYLWCSEDGIKMQGYNGSQTWDTSFAIQGIIESKLTASYSNCLAKAHTFLKNAQIQDNATDRELWYRDISKGGWAFSTTANGWPVSDCTAEGLKTVLMIEQTGLIPDHLMLKPEKVYDAVDLMLSYQNKDGGWPTYEASRGYNWFELLNPSVIFGDIMIDYSHIECTSACINALLKFQSVYNNKQSTTGVVAYKSNEISSAISNALQYVYETQQPDGSWYGNWGVCYTYGTWFGVLALKALNIQYRDSVPMQRACQFLLSKQQDDGGWSESFASCYRKCYIPLPTSQVVQTAWALITLLRAIEHEPNFHTLPEWQAITRGIAFLVCKQVESGDWEQEAISGVFNRSCGITYTSYRNVFPYWAIGIYCTVKNAIPEEQHIAASS